jgi:hypothetical protein
MLLHIRDCGGQVITNAGRSTKTSVALLSPRSKKPGKMPEEDQEPKKEPESNMPLITWPPPLEILARQATNRMRDDPALLGDLSQEDYYALWDKSPFDMQNNQCGVMMWFYSSAEWLDISRRKMYVAATKALSQCVRAIRTRFPCWKKNNTTSQTPRARDNVRYARPKYSWVQVISAYHVTKVMFFIRTA